MMRTEESGGRRGDQTKSVRGEDAPRGAAAVPFDTQPRRQVGPVAVGDVRIIFEGHRDLFVGVEANAAGHQDRPVLVAAQLDVVRALQQFLMHDSPALFRPRLPGEGASPLAPPPRSRRRWARCSDPPLPRPSPATQHRRLSSGPPPASQPALTSARRAAPPPTLPSPIGALSPRP